MVMRSRRGPRWLVGAGGCVVALLAVLVIGLLRWGPLGEKHPDVPRCDAVSSSLPAVVGGAWSVRRPAPSPPATATWR
ncbi:hypothetical protein H4W31_006647 [Plantactinospora soyae]|uniref:Uncharacterized protein n=1 Tax=Plantactinospora soyae TaxID=1544732 RepID=A0A927R932_9ACTN|nr:hypothetical protein [Plantactinospora soyae]